MRDVVDHAHTSRLVFVPNHIYASLTAGPTQQDFAQIIRVLNFTKSELEDAEPEACSPVSEARHSLVGMCWHVLTGFTFTRRRSFGFVTKHIVAPRLSVCVALPLDSSLRYRRRG